jgi:monothiol glutaredoxin
MELKGQIVHDINTHSIILYIKGTKDMLICGFSNIVPQILNHYGVPFKNMNILEDPMTQVKISEYSN